MNIEKYQGKDELIILYIICINQDQYQGNSAAIISSE